MHGLTLILGEWFLLFEMKKNIGFWSFSNHLQKKVIPSIQNNKNIILYKLLTSKKIETVRKNFFLKKKLLKIKLIS